MKIKNILLIAATASAVILTGCASHVISTPTTSTSTTGNMIYETGSLKTVEQVSQERAHTATLAALKDLQFGLVGDVTEAAQQRVSARTSTDKKVLVVLEKESESITAIRVTVGAFGDEAMSLQVMNKIKSHL